MAVTTIETSDAAQQRVYPRRAAVVSWIFFDWAAQPYFTLITTFVFAPYFAAHVAPDAASGQALWGFATAAAGIVIALLSPVFGAIADATGRRKPWIAAFGAMLVVGSCLMWIGRPGAPELIVPLLAAYVLATIGVEFATVFNNAMMPTLVPPERIGRLSGTGWATGYIGGIVSLILVLGFLAANPDSGRTLFGLQPLFGLDPVTHEGDRISGPLTGLWFIVFVLPMFLFTPDYPARHRLGATFSDAPGRTNARPARGRTGGRRSGAARRAQRQRLRIRHQMLSAPSWPLADTGAVTGNPSTGVACAAAGAAPAAASEVVRARAVTSFFMATPEVRGPSRRACCSGVFLVTCSIFVTARFLYMIHR